MRFVSYARNFEDVILWRALKNVNNGFYIDVGAGSPDDHSVTKAFYMRSWRGINAEPNPYFYLQLVAERTLDVNLQITVSKNSRATEFNAVETTASRNLNEIVEKAQSEQDRKAPQIEAPFVNLNDIWSNHVPRGIDVHFLKIAAEGAEDSVIQSNNWQENRPWIILVDSARQISEMPTESKWEHILLNSHYLFVYFDGLNRYYVAEEHKRLLAFFSRPPNVFDDFIVAEAEYANVRATEAEQQVKNLLLAKYTLELANRELSTTITNIYSSKSWKITKPLRLIKSCLLVLGKIIRPKNFLRLSLKKTISFVESHPRLKRIFVRVLSKMPFLKAFLKTVLYGTTNSSGLSIRLYFKKTQSLSERTKQVFKLIS